jgi:hypothetical protein
VKNIVQVYPGLQGIYTGTDTVLQMWPPMFYYASTTINEQGKYTGMHKDFHKRSTTNMWISNMQTYERVGPAV